MLPPQLVVEGRGIAFFDSAENVSVDLRFDRVVEPLDIETPGFPVPIDRAVEVQAGMVRIDSVPEVIVRDADGRPVPTDPESNESLPEAAYVIEISCPLKLYVAVTAPVTVRTTGSAVEITFGAENRVVIGARVVRSAPPPTVQTTRDVSELFTALSTFGGSIGSSGTDRSFPAVRNHPPRLEIGDTLSIPPGVEPPATGVQLELPADPLSGALAAPLAYYLGAELVASTCPGIVADGERLLDFEPERSLGQQCSSLLDRVLFLECLTEHKFTYDVQLHERESLADRVDVDWAALGDEDPIERLRAVLAVPWDAIRELVPPWRPSVSFLPTDRGLESLPFLADELASLREPTTPIVRGSSFRPPVATDGGQQLAIPARGLSESNETATMSGRHRSPIGLDRSFPSAYENRLNRGDSDGITVAVVCNDRKMGDELEYVRSSYDRPEDPFVTVRLYEGLTRLELEELIAQPIDYLHYIGHIHSPGFMCTDGFLDIASVDAVGVEVAFINACESYEQALNLVEAGSVTAIATRAKVLNEPAVKVGKQVADLLINGFPTGAALELVRPHGLIGYQYTVIGDPTLAIVQPESGVPYFCSIEAAAEGQFTLTIRSLATSLARAGTGVTFRITEDAPYYLNPATVEFTVDRATLRSFLSKEVAPVLVDGQLRWSHEPLDRLVTNSDDP